jgi:kynurenine formamidase
MKIKALVIGYVLALALFLFANRHPAATPLSSFHAVIDLTSANNQQPFVRETTVRQAAYGFSSERRDHGLAAAELTGTRLDAPARVGGGLWTVDQIPAERLVAPLVVLDVRARVQQNPDYQISVTDIANWERSHGEIPMGAVVMAFTRPPELEPYTNHVIDRPGYSEEAARFLVDGRKIVGIGIDSQNIDQGLHTDLAVYRYTLSHSAYVLKNVANLDRAPASGGIVMVAPIKLENQLDAPVRILALAR